ncbi:hypothetical protein NOCA180202 [metagenome]|uniref:Uncharacterized protein n=1 Tax=metagenome TaxID=256318 RepID=A0A2P2CKQ5_9ZZZZ
MSRHGDSQGPGRLARTRRIPGQLEGPAAACRCPVMTASGGTRPSTHGLARRLTHPLVITAVLSVAVLAASQSGVASSFWFVAAMAAGFSISGSV